MQDTIEVLNNDLAYSLFKNMQSDNLEYTYRGDFNSAIAENILSLVETNFGDVNEKTMVRKRVYFIMVECLQNITRHQEDKPKNAILPSEFGLFVVRRKNYAYYITTGNLIKNESIENISTRIETINSMDGETLKNYSREILKEGNYSNKGGAGLGLIEMARKSGRKLKYNFHNLGDGYSYFYLHMCVPFDKEFTPESEAEYKQYSESVTLKLHKTLILNNIVLNFSGILNQDNLINLLNILSRQITTSKMLKTKVYGVMIELLQNVLSHADQYTIGNCKGTYGLFYITDKDSELILTFGNFVKNSKVNQMKQLLEKINSTNKEERVSLMHTSNPEGIGFMAIRNKSKNKYTYHFTKIDEDFSFFSINIKLNKIDNI